MTLTPEHALAAADEGIRSGDLAWSEALCRMVLEQQPQNALAWNLLGTICMRVNLLDYAAEYFSRGKGEQPQWDGRAKTLATGATQRRYILMKSAAHGFWSDVDHVLGGLLLAELTGRTPVVHWGDNSLFKHASAANAWDLFFQPLTEVTIDDLASVASFYPPKWSADNLRSEEVDRWRGPWAKQTALHFLGREEAVLVSGFHIALASVIPWIRPGRPRFGQPTVQIYRDLVARYLHPKPAIVAAVDAFQRKHLAGGPFVAVHIRGADKYREQKDLQRINQSYFEQVDRLATTPGQRIFLLTDSQPAADEFRRRYGQRVVMTPSERSADETGVHLRPGDGLRRGTEVMIDAYLAARAGKFIGNGGSNVSAIVAHLKQWNHDDLVLLAPIRQHRIRPFLFRPV